MQGVFPSAEFDTQRARIPLDGAWAFSYDAENVGIKEQWFSPEKKLPEEIKIPGCSQAKKYESSQGNVRVTDVDIPEQSQTIMLKYGCMHPSWYQRMFKVPAEWNGKRVQLHAGGVKPCADFWINGNHIGSTLTSRSPVRAELSPHVKFGEENVLTVRIHWAKYRLDGVFDVWHAWSGIYRSIWIEEIPDTYVADVYARPSVNPKSVKLELTLREKQLRSRVKVSCLIMEPGGEERYAKETVVTMRKEEIKLAVEIPMQSARLWDVHEPNLYKAVVKLSDAGNIIDECSVRFGLRDIRVKGPRILLNGIPVFLRGGCDDHVYPMTVCPPADKSFYVERIKKAKEYGYNYTKSACEVFTKEFLDAGDELGYLVCQEMPFGVLGELRALRNNPPEELVDLWRRELANIVTASRNHPSVIIYSMASEHDINLENPVPYKIFSNEFPKITRHINPKALVVDVTAGFCKSVQTRHGKRDTDIIEDCIENSYTLTPFHGLPEIPDTVTRPFILHEWNWITSLSDPDIVRRYEDLPLVPVQVPEMIKSAEENGVLDELPAMVENSRKLKWALRKDAYELAYEHPKIAGYHGWLIHDVCYCAEGVFNEFWEEPQGLSAEEFRAYNNDTVLVLDDNDKRCFYYNENVPMGIVIAHFGNKPLDNASLKWRVTAGTRVIKEGQCAIGRIECGKRVRVRNLGIKKIAGDSPAVLELFVELHERNGKVCQNRWNLWLFPDARKYLVPNGTVSSVALPFGNVRKSFDPFVPPENTRVFVTQRLTDGSNEPIEGLIKFIDCGGRVLLLSNGAIQITESCMYRTVPYNLGKKGNMGTVINPHPAIGDFPHDGWCDFVFIPMIEGAYPMRLDVFRPYKIHPIIRSIGHPVNMEDKAYLFEIGIGKGVLLACGLEISALSHVYPTSGYLLYCMINYLCGDECRPGTIISPEEFRRVIYYEK